MQYWEIAKDFYEPPVKIYKIKGIIKLVILVKY